jgi:hypothetical protein
MEAIRYVSRQPSHSDGFHPYLSPAVHVLRHELSSIGHCMSLGSSLFARHYSENDLTLQYRIDHERLRVRDRALY